MTYYIDSFFKNYANFSGRCSRTYFWSVLVTIFIFIGISFLPFYFLNGLDILGLVSRLFFGIVLLVHLIPFLSLLVRRVHDLDYSIWYMFIPLFNLYLLFLVLFFRGTEGANNFGDETVDID